MRSCSELSKIQRFSWLIKEFKGTACQNRRRLRTKADSPGQQGRASLDDAMSQNLRELRSYQGGKTSQKLHALILGINDLLNAIEPRPAKLEEPPSS